ncbi:hypothetical protein [Frigidibacter oleivorans]|uniref:hypothetical protein n=1 Tax=Frigidibacter oleivorans TaxID=2487129 RepID=UPI000F8F1131|nr:hypothetical protein [Frigidibacter oleivorans]
MSDTVLIEPLIAAFVAECRIYCQRRGISLGTLGSYAASNSKLFQRLEAKGECELRTMRKIREYMQANPPNAIRNRRKAR